MGELRVTLSGAEADNFFPGWGDDGALLEVRNGTVPDSMRVQAGRCQTETVQWKVGCVHKEMSVSVSRRVPFCSLRVGHTLSTVSLPFHDPT